MKKMTFSFKSTDRDVALYNVMSRIEDKSFYIKEALRQLLENEVEEELKKIREKKENQTVNIDYLFKEM